ncbi:MAG: ABC transporter substrate-binding protein, partial [Betaproteobacteria bacterium]|nr:ABC transporter substrate-binding protein [Betaproteobacteria bacterium]
MSTSRAPGITDKSQTGGSLSRPCPAITIFARRALCLTRTYAGALQTLRDQKIRLKPFRGDAADNEVVVRSEIVGSRGDPIGLDYRLYRQGESWKIYDINIAGVWLVETYRN